MADEDRNSGSSTNGEGNKFTAVNANGKTSSSNESQSTSANTNISSTASNADNIVQPSTSVFGDAIRVRPSGSTASSLLQSHRPHEVTVNASQNLTSLIAPTTDDSRGRDSVRGNSEDGSTAQKRKRSPGRSESANRGMSPGAQTQRHHLAAHEAAIADNQSARSPSLQLPGDDHFSSAAEEQRYHNDSMLQRPGGNDASPLSNQADPKRRKRVFSNRTKTGCITCRRRKKKCDEGKPECINCKRGGFVCEGYSGKVSWQKPPGKTGSSHTALIRSEEDRPDSSSASPIARQVSQTLMPHPPAATSITTTPVRLERPVETPRPDDAAKKTQEDLRSPSKTLPTGTYASSVASQVTPRPSVTTTVPPATSTPAATAAASTTIPGNPPQSEKQRQLAYSHTALNAATGSFSTPQMRSEKQKMISSELYHASAPELVAERDSCKAACWRFNHIAANPSLNVSEAEKGRLLLDVLRPGQNWEVVGTGGAAGAPGPCTYVTDMGTTSDIVDVQVDAPFNCSYGYNIRLGKNVYIEFGCTILDSCSVTIKDRTILSPNVSIYSATHPIDPRKRNGSRGPEMAKPVMIEEDCWLGGNVTVLGGIVIGKGSVVGAGSVVTRDVPPFTVVAGNPARVIRGIYQNGLDM